MKQLKIWIEALRLRTLPVSLSGVVIAVALAHYLGCLQWTPAVLCLLFALLAQIVSNLANEYYDYLRGADKKGRVGPRRGVTEGDIKPDTLKWVTIGTLAAACAVGCGLLLYGPWWLLIAGIVIALAAFAYSAGPYPLSYHGLGEAAVFVFFGLVPVNLTYFVQSGTVNVFVILASVSIGLMGVNVLLVNNYRDIDNDRRTGKITLIVRIGARGGLWLYLLLGVVACVLTVAVIACRNSWWALLVLLYLPFHVDTAAEMRRIGRGAELNRVLGKTARNMFLYGLLSSAALLA